MSETGFSQTMSAADLRASLSADSLLAKLSVLEQRGTYEERALGDIFAGWDTVRHLGAGSHGRCYLMRKPDGSLVVHKRVPVSHMKAAEQEAAEREVNILATFNHPYIIRYDHAFVRQGQLNIVMEHASGGDLAGHLRTLDEAGERPSVATVLDWFVQLLLALECVHSCKVLHRDVAAKNVFLGEGGVLKLGDFGVARVLASTLDMAQTKVGVPTPCLWPANGRWSILTANPDGRWARRATSRPSAAKARRTRTARTCGQWAACSTRCSVHARPLRPRPSPSSRV